MEGSLPKDFSFCLSVFFIVLTMSRPGVLIGYKNFLFIPRNLFHPGSDLKNKGAGPEILKGPRGKE
jgi:hypothetical protein